MRTSGPRLLPSLSGLFLVFIVFIAVSWGSVQAACSWTWDCTDGRCKQIPMCDHPYEIPPIQPLEAPPVPPPSLKPLQPYVFAPPGKSACREAYLCNRNGQCRWKSVCE
jgi:hypothetical protein